jgi:hypothetical protein
MDYVHQAQTVIAVRNGARFVVSGNPGTKQSGDQASRVFPAVFPAVIYQRY